MKKLSKQQQIKSSQLTPSRSIITYLIILFILLLLDAEQVIPMLNRLSLDIPPVRIAAQFIQTAADVSKLTAFSNFETTTIKQLSSTTIIGETLTNKSHIQEEEEEEEGNSYASSEQLEETHKLQQDNVLSHAELLQPNEFCLPLPSNSELEERTTELTSIPSTDNIDKPIQSDTNTILIIGDSMVNEGLGPVLQKTLHNQNKFKVIREGHYSTGLSRQDYFNWPERLSYLINKHHPKLIIVCLGANDAQDIFDSSNQRYHPGSQEWKKIYTNRAKHFLNIATSQGSTVIWAGLPVMGKMPYATRILSVNECQKKACDETLHVQFIDTQSVLATPQGKYTTYLQESNKHIRLRAKDKIHVTEAGGKILMNHLMPYIKQSLEQIHAKQSTDMKEDISLLSSKNSITICVPSLVRQASIPCSVFLPQNKEQKKYPVLLLLHDLGYTNEIWEQMAGEFLQQMATFHQIVIIAPDGGKESWYVDSPLIQASQIESFIIDELRTTMLEQLPIIDKWSISGISMGGHGAITLGLRHSTLYTSMSAINGVLNLMNHSDEWGIKNVLGELHNHQQLWESHSAYHLLDKIAQNVPPILVSTDLATPLLDENRCFSRKASECNISIEYNEVYSNQNWDYYLSQLPIHIEFHAKKLHHNSTVSQGNDQTIR